MTTTAPAPGAHAIACPGQQLGSVSEYESGPHTYIRDGVIYASAVGIVKILVSNTNTKVLTIDMQKTVGAVPAVGKIIHGKVTRNVARVSIMSVDDILVNGVFDGIIRFQDVRQTEIDKVQMLDCFRPGDVVRAVVISLGDSRSYYLSTAANFLGVVLARSSAGFNMVPISWEEMKCPQTQTTEKRKVAQTEIADDATTITALCSSTAV